MHLGSKRLIFELDLGISILCMDTCIIQLGNHHLIGRVVRDCHRPKASGSFRQPIVRQCRWASNNCNRLISKEVTIGDELVQLIPLRIGHVRDNSFEAIYCIVVHVLKLAHFTECLRINSSFCTKNPLYILWYNLR